MIPPPKMPGSAHSVFCLSRWSLHLFVCHMAWRPVARCPRPRGALLISHRRSASQPGSGQLDEFETGESVRKASMEALSPRTAHSCVSLATHPADSVAAWDPEAAHASQYCYPYQAFHAKE